MKTNNLVINLNSNTINSNPVNESKVFSNHRKTIDGKSFAEKIDPIAEKREEAKKKAMKVVGDAWTNEKKIDDDVKGRKDRIKELQSLRHEYSDEINKIKASRDALRDELGVDKNSQEEQDLKLLEKEIDSKLPGSDVTLTDEERKRAFEIRKNGLTEYQERSLEMKDWETEYVKADYEAKQEMKFQNQVINQTEIDRLKSHAMVDAGKAKDAILDEANKEIMGMLIDEAKDHVDEKNEEEKETAKEKAEEKEELEARLEKAKENKKEKEEFVEDIIEGSSELVSATKDMEQAQQEVKDMLSKMKLIEDDIKGAAVDKSM